MKQLLLYIKAMRANHYIKNVLIFVPLFFSGKFMNLPLLGDLCLSFLMFSFICSSVYILNDVVDYEYDKNHLLNYSRPIASGQIRQPPAIVFSITLTAIGMFGLSFLNWQAVIVAFLYYGMNIAYSLRLKTLPLLDVFCIATGFVLRIFIGAAAANIMVSNWLLLTIYCLSLFLAFGKRRNELVQSTGKIQNRKVLSAYSVSFLDKSMQSMMTLTIAFYSLWTLDTQQTRLGGGFTLVITVPIVIFALLRYITLIDSSVYGDPTYLILKDRGLHVLTILLVSIMAICLYF